MNSYPLKPSECHNYKILLNQLILLIVSNEFRDNDKGKCVSVNLIMDWCKKNEIPWPDELPF